MRTAKIRIALVGAGQIGSRHLQAIGRIQKWPVEVHVVEPDPVSAGLAQDRLHEVVPHSDSGSLRAVFCRGIEQLPSDIDFAIVATSSAVRRACIEALLARSSVEYLLLEKVLFQKEEDYPAVGRLLAAKGTKTWVNCARRLWPLYQAIQKDLAPAAEPIDLQVTGSRWGLGCNAIHLLDLFAFLTRNTDLELDCRKLDPDPIPSKRPGYLEFTGLLAGRNPQGSTVSLLSNRVGSLPLMVAIGTGEKSYLLMEDAFQVTLSHRPSSRWEVTECKAPLQSQLTNQVVETVWENGSCQLTPYDESARLHLVFIRALSGFLEQRQGERVTACPIT